MLLAGNRCPNNSPAVCTLIVEIQNAAGTSIKHHFSTSFVSKSRQHRHPPSPITRVAARGTVSSVARTAGHRRAGCRERENDLARRSGAIWIVCSGGADAAAAQRRRIDRQSRDDVRTYGSYANNPFLKGFSEFCNTELLRRS